MRKIYLLGLLYVGLSLVYLMRSPEPVEISDDLPFTVTFTVEDPPDADPTDAASWFRSMKGLLQPGGGRHPARLEPRTSIRRWHRV